MVHLSCRVTCNKHGASARVSTDLVGDEDSDVEFLGDLLQLAEHSAQLLLSAMKCALVVVNEHPELKTRHITNLSASSPLPE